MAAQPVRAQFREILIIAAPIILLSALAFWAAYQFVAPAPPSTITFTSGSPDGAYTSFARDYKARLGQAGIDVQIETSKGSMENLDRLSQDPPIADVALIQGGTADASTAPGIVSLGRVFTEPLWVFYRAGAEPVTVLGSLRGKRLAVGAQGSGTRILADALLTLNQLDAANTTILPISGKVGADALRTGEADAVFLVMSPSASLIKELLKDPEFELMNFTRGEAYTRLLPYLTTVTLPAGVIDLVGNVPKENVTLIAPEAALVAREDTHPAIIDLLVGAAIDIHGTGGMFRRIDEYPKAQDPDFPLSSDAKRVYQQGAPFLRRYLPFWLATFIERMLVMIVPIATILIPLVKIVPMIYEWRIKSRINYWYAHLKQIEKGLREDATGERTQEFQADIDEIDDAVSAIPVPLHFSDRFYELRAAVDLVRHRIVARTQAPS